MVRRPWSDGNSPPCQLRHKGTVVHSVLSRQWWPVRSEDLDFISQASLESNIELPADCLHHQEVALSIIEKVSLLPAGSMIGVQGPWGRGKTDVLARIAKTAGIGSGHTRETGAAIWINPWQYGTPDLLSPIVIALLKKIRPKERTKSEALWKAAESVIKAGLSFGLKATALTIPGGQIYDAAAKEATSLLEGLFRARELDRKTEPDPDPVSEMGHRFAELVGEALAVEKVAGGTKLLICVDDLDRCLPHRQVALLEALHFLISAQAQATILVALDPTLARQSVIAHYGTDTFDPERYLDKMFDLRVTLPSISGENLNSLIRSKLGTRVAFQGEEIKRAELASRSRLFTDIENSLQKALFLPDFRNPRMIDRILRRIHLLFCSGVPLEMDITQGQQWLLILWLALIERRPEVRAAFQDVSPSNRDERLHRMDATYQFTESVYHFPGTPTPAPLSEIQAKRDSHMRSVGMPAREQAPDMCTVFAVLWENHKSWTPYEHRLNDPKEWTLMAKIFTAFDDLLVQAGL